jgi:alpha/beta superfamily hydrolase
MDLVLLALDHGVGSISDARGEALIPFLLTQEDSGRSLKRFAGATLEESVAMARAHAATLPASVQVVAIAFDGFVTLEGTKAEAVIVQVQRRGSARSGSYAQRYLREGTRITTLGNALSLGDGELLF